MKRTKGVQQFNKFRHEKPKIQYNLKDIVLQLEGRLQAAQLAQENRLSNQQQELKKELEAAG
jgi:hypothetical protein